MARRGLDREFRCFLDLVKSVIQSEVIFCGIISKEKTGGNHMSELEHLITRDEDIERASRSIKAMSHPLRLKILCALGDREVNVQDIVSMVGTSQSNISQHLAILRDKGILASRKDANRVFYRVSDARTLALIGMMREVFCSAE